MVVQPVSTVVFDLGGVLAEFGGVARMRALSGVESDEELWRRWLSCDWVRRFERGRCTPEEFAQGVVDDWGLALDADGFLDEFGRWLVGPLPGAAELVASVRSRVRVACLSNTNHVHWAAGAARWPLLREFDRTFLSFEIGLVKPDREMFDHVVSSLGVPAGEIVFLDDNALNVDAANDVGLRARRVVGVQQAREALVEMRVLDG